MPQSFILQTENKGQLLGQCGTLDCHQTATHFNTLTEKYCCDECASWANNYVNQSCFVSYNLTVGQMGELQTH